jgi:predicted nucleotidyltransferase
MEHTMNHITTDFPGTTQHQALLRHIVKYYQGDARVLSVIVLGSLGRGNWDKYSDLDLDVVITDDAEVHIEEELRALSESFAPLGEYPAIIFAEEPDEGEIVLESLMMLSIRYHPLAGTNYSIVDSMRMLSGNLDHETIAAAGPACRMYPQFF